MRAKSLAICAILIFSGCSTPQPREIPLPQCEQPQPIDQEIWNNLSLLRDVTSNNALIYQECIKKYRSRIELFNET